MPSGYQLEPDDALHQPDDGLSFSSGSGVGLPARFDKPDAASGLEDRTGTGLLALRIGFVGLVEGIRVYEVEIRTLSSTVLVG